MTSRRTAVLAAIAVFLLSPFAVAKDFKPASGVYDGLLLAVDPASGAVSGYIRAGWIGNGTAAAPQFTCEFAFAGAAGEQKIVAWQPGGGLIAAGATTIGGAISLKANGLTLTLQSRPGGCQYLMGDDASLDQNLSARHDWRAVRVVGIARAYFYDAPDEKTRRKAFVVRDDGVGVLRMEQDWAEVEFVGDQRATRGWMKTGDFYPDAPPKSDGPVHANAEVAPRAALEEFLRAYVKAAEPEPDRETRYLAAEARLKEDGKAQTQTLVYLLGDDWCGSGGCTMLVLDPDGQTYRVVTQLAPVRLPVRALSSQRNGWRDIGVWVGGGGIIHGYEATLTFDGRTYPDNPTVVRAKFGRREGRELLSEGDVGAPLFP